MSERRETCVVVLITQRNRTRSVTPTIDTNRVRSHDPLSDMCALFPQALTCGLACVPLGY